MLFRSEQQGLRTLIWHTDGGALEIRSDADRDRLEQVLDSVNKKVPKRNGAAIGRMRLERVGMREIKRVGQPHAMYPWTDDADR